MYGNNSLLLASLEATDGGTRYLIFGAIMLPAVVMAITKSTWLVEYYFLVVCTNRLIRRVVDWMGGEFDSKPLSSLTPMLIALLMLCVVIVNYQSVSKENRKLGSILMGVLVVSSILGVQNGIAMIYAFFEYLTPLGVLGYAIWLGADSTLLIRWLRSISVMACAIAVYAWFQWVEMPPWDAFWIEQSGMWSSMGTVENYRTSVCGTLESRGPFAWFMATLAMPLILIPSARSYVTWIGVILLVSSILPTTVRSAFGMIGLAMVGYGLVRGVSKSVHLIALLGMILIAMIGIRRNLPESEYLFERLESVTKLSEDSSFRGRVGQSRVGFGKVLSNPLGFGLGCSGLGTNLTGENAIIADNGYLELLATFGIIGVGMGLFIAFYTARKIYDFARFYNDDASYLILSLFFALLGALLFSNWLPMSCSSIAMLCLAKVLVDMEQKNAETLDDEAFSGEFEDYRLEQEGVLIE
jgi:putative inorganic carbon (HCO3(-)) transporter